MATPIVDDKHLDDVEKLEHAHSGHESKALTAVEVSKSDNAPAGYVAASDYERRLDVRINRKLDLLLLPICAINFLLCGVDKSGVGNAATTSFIKDANLTLDDIGDAVSLLSVTFVMIMIAWGATTAAHAAIKNRGTLIALRLLLGLWEASFFPSSVYFLSTVYPRYSLGFRLGLFAGMHSIAGAFSGLIAYGCFQLPASAPIHGWQFFFILLGCITILFAGVTYLVFPKDNRRVWFLNAEEQAHLVSRMERDIAAHTSSEDSDISGSGFRWRDVKDALVWHKLLIIIGNIFATLPVSAFGTFMPLIVAGMGCSGVRANLMSVSPFVVGAVLLWIIVASSDRFRERSLHTCASMALVIVGLAVMYASDDPKLRYGFTHLALGGAFVGGPLILVWLVGNTPVTSTRALVTGVNGQLFKAQYKPEYKFPLRVTMILMGESSVGIVIFLAMRGYYMYINRQRRAKVATMTPAEIEAERQSTVRRGDQKVTFIYGV
ncbi:hypothetical protein JCM8097_007427 [Rhodosporidiobolus ruineniae]